MLSRNIITACIMLMLFYHCYATRQIYILLYPHENIIIMLFINNIR